MYQNLFKLLFIGVLSVLCVSNTNSTKKTDKILKSAEINFEPFSELPNEIDGSGCSFYATESEQRKGEYIFVNDFANIAFIKLHGQMFKFILSEHKVNSNTYVYNNGEYTLTVEITKKQRADYEMSKLEGVLTLCYKGISIRQKCIGSCGC